MMRHTHIYVYIHTYIHTYQRWAKYFKYQVLEIQSFENYFRYQVLEIQVLEIQAFEILFSTLNIQVLFEVLQNNRYKTLSLMFISQS